MAEEVKKKRSRGAWFREMKSELKKVVWPDRKTVIANTGTVLLCSLVIGACIWIFDGGKKDVRQREVVCDPYLFRL